MFDILEKRFRQVLPAVDFCSLRYNSEQDEVLSVRQNVPQPAQRATDAGVMITVIH
ncbi:MAG: TldD/PmbA family protein, partial [Planctomycetaceae bacterium]